MRTISLKISPGILEDIDQQLEVYRFSTRTEFIRQAIREKLDKLERERFESDMRKYFTENKKEMAKELKSHEDDVFAELERRFTQL